MELDELKAIWKKQNKSQHLSESQVVMLLTNKMTSFNERIESRDRREIWVAAAVSLFCGVLFFIVESIWLRLGCITLILACALISYKLRTARYASKEQEIRPDTSFKEHLQVELQKIKNQKNLLESVLWWYLTPIFAGILFFVIGFDQQLTVKAIYLVGVLILYGYIWKLNQDAVSKYLDPLIEDINEAIIFINSNQE